MKNKKTARLLLTIELLFLFSVLAFPSISFADTIELPGMQLSITDGTDAGGEKTATAFKLLLALTLLSLAPSLMIMMTSFTRIIIVLSMLRHAFGMQQTPPNTVLVGLALMLTIFTMMPVFKDINNNALQPYFENKIESKQALETGMKPLREFMIKQTREQDLAVVLEINGKDIPDSVDDIESTHLISAFLLSELKTAFQIGFVIFLPFLLVDLVVASILMSMGMIMVPPLMISLPLKVLMFVLIDGWALVVQSLLGSFA